MILQGVVSWLASLVISVINSTGELGIFLLMAIESLNIPLPSEVIMPFAGFEASRGAMSFWAVVLVGALGNLAGSAASYWIGRSGGRPFLERWGRFILVRRRDLERGDYYFQKYGVKIAFWSRLVPIVRTFISLPAGINRAPFGPFALFTFAGSFLWSTLLTWLGFSLGERWDVVGPYFERVGSLILGLLIFLAGLYIWHHLKNGKSVASDQ